MSLYALNEQQKENWRTIRTQFVFWLCVYGLFRLYGSWHEQEGVIKTEDCRAHVQLSGPGDPRAWFHKFTCETLGGDANGNNRVRTCNSTELDGGVCVQDSFYLKTIKAAIPPGFEIDPTVKQPTQ
jgi:hypothetical protein